MYLMTGDKAGEPGMKRTGERKLKCGEANRQDSEAPAELSEPL